MSIRRIPVEQLVGINRNAAHGASQLAPVEIRGFDLDRMGGYVAAWRQATSAHLTGVEGVVRAYDPYGNALLSGSRVLLGGVVSSQGSGSIGGKGTYLVPRVGVFADPNPMSGDEYQMGAYFTDSMGATGDLNRVTGLTTTASGSGSGIGDGTYRFLVLVEAPTAHGFAVYQTLTAEQAASSNDDIEIELDDALPLGYSARCYWWLLGSGEPSFTQVGFRKVSDGSQISFTFDDDTVDVTTDAILGFDRVLRRVEPHRQRMWGVAGTQAFLGPYVAGFTVENRFQANLSDGEFLLSTPDSATLDTLDTSDNMSVFAEFNEGMSWQASTGEVLWSVDHEDLSDGASRHASDVAIDEDGNTLAVLNLDASSEDSALVKLDPDGTELWDVTLSDPWRFVAVAVDKDGNVYAAANNMDSAEALLRKYNSGGVAQWTVDSDDLVDLDGALLYDLAVEWDGSHVYATAQESSGGFLVHVQGDGTVSGPVSVSDYMPFGITADPLGDVTVGFAHVSADETLYRKYSSGFGGVMWSRTRSFSGGRQPAALAWLPSTSAGSALDVAVLHSDPASEASVDFVSVFRLRGHDGATAASTSLPEENTDPRARSIAAGPSGQILVAGRAFNDPDVLVLEADTLEVLDIMEPAAGFTWSVATNRRGEVAAGTQTDGQFPGHVVRLRSTHQWAVVAKRGAQFETGLVFSLASVGGAVGEVAHPYVFLDGLEHVNLNMRVTNGASVDVWTHGSPTTLLASLQFEFELRSSIAALWWGIRDSGGSLVVSDSETAWWPTSTMTTVTDGVEFGGAEALSGGELRQDWLWTELYDDDSQTSTLVSAEAEDWSSGTTFTSSETGETWTINEDVGGIAGGLATFSSTLNPTSTLIYSDVGDVNSGGDENYVQLELLASQRITALASTPAGLAVFCDNESFLVRSDPSLPDFQVQRLSGTIGCDAGVQPGRLGNVVFPIWQGRVYVVSLGMGDVDFGGGLSDISADVFDPSDTFVQVVGEPRSRQVLARTRSGVILRYAPERQAWFTDVYSEEGVELLLPADGVLGTRYRLSDELWLAVAGADEPNVRWEQVDLGDKVQRKLWRRVYAYTNDEYEGAPELEYEIGSRSGTVFGRFEGEGQWSFTFPGGIVASTAQSLNLVLASSLEGDALEQPLEIEVVDRYRRR